MVPIHQVRSLDKLIAHRFIINAYLQRGARREERE